MYIDIHICIYTYMGSLLRLAGFLQIKRILLGLHSEKGNMQFGDLEIKQWRPMGNERDRSNRSFLIIPDYDLLNRLETAPLIQFPRHLMCCPSKLYSCSTCASDLRGFVPGLWVRWEGAYYKTCMSSHKTGCRLQILGPKPLDP